MDDERKIWERMDDEPVKWFSRFDSFRLMKPWRRSVNAVFLDEQTKTPRNPEKPRENADKEWYQKAKEWEWDERAAAWDAYRIAERDRLIELEEAEVMKEQYALRHERIKALSEVADLLREEVFEEKKHWVEDVKSVGNEAHYVKKFNKGIISEYRASLDDIATEMGERVKKKEIALTEMPANVYMFDPDQDGTEVAEEEDGSDQAVSDS